MAKANDYVAVAGAEKRLRSMIDGMAFGPELADQFVTTLLAEATIEYKPRMKAITVTIPIPQPKPEPKLGAFSPKPVPENGYEDLEAPVE